MNIVPGYRIMDKIYQGTRTIIYRGRREEDDTPVIIKMPSPQLFSAQDLGKLRHEYEITKGLSLRGILKPYALQKVKENLALIFEDIGGELLKTLVASRKISPREFLDIAIPLVETLRVLHQKNIIHKNISPQHIIINTKTGEVRLTDFGIASVLPREDPRIIRPSLLEGTLPYISPEQTGRMNRILDYRTDFYSLGVTFYEMLTGKLPFQATDALELVHCHMARMPLPAHELEPEIPKAISDILRKLMAKTAEERYQSASGIKVDLEECRTQLHSTGEIKDFHIARHDISEKLRIAQGLYGREEEIEVLLALFERVIQGKTEMAMVSGYAGIGKTSLVNEMYKSITEKRGLFISGKFEQLQRNIPYSALIHAFQDLVRELLTENRDKLDHWKEEILFALGANGQVIIDVIPDVELIIGPQSPVVELGLLESQNRFNLVFRSFLRVFAKKEHPLVIFLDDLQWVDTATLKLIELMITDEDTRYLLFIGAYRDNEVDLSHPLMTFLEDLQDKGAPITRLGVGPLGDEQVTKLVADTIGEAHESVATLANLVVQKTNGNPFFVNQFLTTLYEEGLLTFESEERKWKWETDKIRGLDITDNVVALLISRLKRLSFETQHVLKMAACIGNRFGLRTLSMITEGMPPDIYRELLPAIQFGLIISMSGSYPEQGLESYTAEEENFKFLHDRVQQAAYSLVSEQEKANVHLKIGRMLLENTAEEAREERIFDILNHLNGGRKLVTAKHELDVLTELNFLAGRKAKASAAYELAYGYFKTALELLSVDCWKNQYELTLKLHNEATEAAYLSGHLEPMESLFEVVIQNARAVLDKVSVYQCKILGHMTENRLSEAIKAGLEVLDMLGVRFSKDSGFSAVGPSVQQTRSVFDEKSIEVLIHLPQMEDPIHLAILKILKDVALCAYLTRFELFIRLLLRGIDIIFNHGNAPLSPFFFCFYGSVLCASLGEIESGFKFGQLGLQLLEKLNARDIRCRTLMAFNVYIRHFKEHIRETIKPLAEAYQAGLETGDLTYAAGSANAHCVREYMAGTNLTKLKKDFETYDDAIRKTNQLPTLYVNRIYHQAVYNLLNSDVERPWMIAGKIYDEKTQLAFHLEADNRNALHYFYFNKLILACLFRRYDEAIESANMAGKYLDEVTGGLAVPVFHFYDSLARLGMYQSSSESEQRRLLKKVASNQEKMKKWADHAPMNHLHKYHLVEAERLRVLHKEMEAVYHYDRAIELAKENEYIHEEAYANELAGRFWFERGKKDFASLYMKRAQRCYAIWGALRKVKHLEDEFPSIIAERPAEQRWPAPLNAGRDDLGLDISTMIKASQAISSEIELERLLMALMKIVTENAGAQRGFLILQLDERLLIVAQGGVGDDEVLLEPSPSIQEVEYVAVGIVTYVARTEKYVVLNDATEEGIFTSDPYVRSHRPKSVLCAPILHKGELIGILYFENNLISGAFTPDRLEVLKLLSSQIAISIENARLYGDLRKAEQKYRGIFENAVEGIYQTTPDGLFVSANPALSKMFAFDSPEELIENITDIEHQLYVSPERRREFVALMQDRQKVSGFEVEFYRRDGSTFWASLHSRPVFDEKNKLLFFEGIVTDISEEKKAMEALREREEYLRKENIRLRSNIKDRYRFGNIVGKSPVMQEVYELILRAAATDVSVIIYGESGTGKELVARAIHEMSERKNGPFVPVNSGAIPENLLESEFFGYKKGAFTGAIADKHGYLDLADAGTLFLDELGEIGLNIQAKLLRAIEGNGFMPLGSTELKKSDFRIISATAKDLKEYVKKELMREDFYYRVHIIPIYLPPLRERKEDIPLLIDHFISVYQYQGKIHPITGKILETMLNYDWPGNVRELQNTIHRYFTLKRLDFLGAPSRIAAGREEISNYPMRDQNLKLREAVKYFEKTYILKKLDQNQWHRSRVASMLGIGRKTLFRKMEDYGIKTTRKGS